MEKSFTQSLVDVLRADAGHLVVRWTRCGLYIFSVLMRRFLCKILLYVLPIFFGAIILELVVERIPNSYTYKRAYMDRYADSICTLVLGHSCAYDGIDAEYDLLLMSQYFIYYLSKHLNIDLSKPNYSEDAMKIYFYKGEL